MQIFGGNPLYFLFFFFWGCEILSWVLNCYRLRSFCRLTGSEFKKNGSTKQKECRPKGSTLRLRTFKSPSLEDGRVRWTLKSHASSKRKVLFMATVAIKYMYSKTIMHFIEKTYSTFCKLTHKTKGYKINTVDGQNSLANGVTHIKSTDAFSRSLFQQERTCQQWNLCRSCSDDKYSEWRMISLRQTLHHAPNKLANNKREFFYTHTCRWYENQYKMFPSHLTSPPFVRKSLHVVCCVANVIDRNLRGKLWESFILHRKQAGVRCSGWNATQISSEGFLSEYPSNSPIIPHGKDALSVFTHVRVNNKQTSLRSHKKSSRTRWSLTFTHKRRQQGGKVRVVVVCGVPHFPQVIIHRYTRCTANLEALVMTVGTQPCSVTYDDLRWECTSLHNYSLVRHFIIIHSW